MRLSLPRRLLTAALGLAAMASSAAVLGAQSTPLTTERIASGLTNPLWAGSPPGDERIFIVEQRGLIKILKNGTVLGTPFLDIDFKTNGTSERGLLALAFHPNFANNGYFYVNYTNLSGNTVVARYEVSAGNDDIADVGSEQILMTVNQPFSNHNGADMAFGPLDGYLYITLGDGGSANDPGCRSQDLTNQLLGKMLRIDVDSGSPYGIPPDNPYAGVGAPEDDEIWFSGLRNVFRFSFDQETGDIYMGDVGQDSWEEINFAPAGANKLNFGWPKMEGNACNNLSPTCSGSPGCFSPSYTDPIFVRQHIGFFGVCSIMGGVVYRGCAIPDLRGTYFTADYCDDVIHSFTYDTTNGLQNLTDRTSELDPPTFSITSITDFGEDADGEILIVDQGGEVFRIIPASTPTGFVDCNGDGFDDACQISENSALDLDLNGELDVCQGLSADTDAVSNAANGIQNLSLHAGVAQGGNVYLMAGSWNSTPGFTLQGFHIPLNIDPFFNFTINRANIPPYVNTFGLLDGSGNASAAFDLSSFTLPPSVIGRTANFAYATTSGGALQYVSNHVTLRFDP